MLYSFSTVVCYTNRYKIYGFTFLCSRTEAVCAEYAVYLLGWTNYIGKDDFELHDGGLVQMP